MARPESGRNFWGHWGEKVAVGTRLVVDLATGGPDPGCISGGEPRALADP